MNHPRETLGLALGLAGMALFAGTLPATRLTVAFIDPLFLSAARAAIAGCAGLLVLTVMRRPLPPRALWGQITMAGVCTIVGFPVSMALAMTSVPAAHGGIVLGIVPLATAAASAIIGHERPSLGFWAASAVGAGVVLLFVMTRNDAASFALGDLFLIGTVISGGFGYAMSGRLSLTMPGWEVISWQVALFLPLSVVVTLALWPQGLADAPAAAWAGLAYVSLVSQFLAFFVFNAGLALGGVARVGQVMLLQPFAIVALAWPVNGEPLKLSTLAYAAAVVAIVLIGQRMRVTRR
ncbi:MAG TPA: DMT family transporter [Pseudolabrys sp.]|nr:DMT family transporter [Pseudolabrys sp.]